MNQYEEHTLDFEGIEVKFKMLKEIPGNFSKATKIKNGKPVVSPDFLGSLLVTMLRGPDGETFTIEELDTLPMTLQEAIFKLFEGKVAKKISKPEFFRAPSGKK